MQLAVSCERSDEQKQVLRRLRRAAHQLDAHFHGATNKGSSVFVFNSINGEMDMGDKGSKDKSKREKQKKAMLTPKEQRKLRNEKKKKNASGFN